MEKISLDDAYEKVGPEKKTRTSRAPHAQGRRRALPLISGKELVRRIRMANLLRFVREGFVRFYLRRTTGLRERGLFVTWQPLYWVLLKIAAVVSLSYLLFSQFPVLSSWLEQGLAFFRLHEIYNFKFPDKTFFDALAQGILLAVIGYYGLWFGYHQALALFSSFVIAPKQRRAYYIRNLVFKKDLFVFSLPDLEQFTLRHNIALRLLGMGTIALRSKGGDSITIRSVARAAQAVKKMTDLKAGADQGKSRRGVSKKSDFKKKRSYAD